MNGFREWNEEVNNITVVLAKKTSCGHLLGELTVPFVTVFVYTKHLNVFF